MTIKEINRFKEINLVIERKRKQSQATNNLKLKTRQIKKLCKRLSNYGPKGQIAKEEDQKEIIDYPIF